MLLTMLMSTAINTHISQTDWHFNQGTDEFTGKQITTLVGQTHDNAFFALDCTGTNLVLSVAYPNHNGNIQASAWGKVDNHQGIRLVGRVYPTGFTISQRLDDGPEFQTLIEQLIDGKAVKWRLFQNDMTPIEISFDLRQAGADIATVLNSCRG